MLRCMASVGKPIFLGKNAAELSVELVQTIAESNRKALKRKDEKRKKKRERAPKTSSPASQHDD